MIFLLLGIAGVVVASVASIVIEAIESRPCDDPIEQACAALLVEMTQRG